MLDALLDSLPNLLNAIALLVACSVTLFGMMLAGVLAPYALSWALLRTARLVRRMYTAA